MTTGDLKIDVATLSSWIGEKKAVTILDVRPGSEREEWSIPEAFTQRLKAGDPNALDLVELDMDKPIVTVCAAGKASLIAAELLKRKGYDVYSLEGGMRAWNYAWNTAEIALDGVKVIQVRRSSKGVLSYIIGSNDEAIVIDAALDPQVYLDLTMSNGWTIKYVTDTHVHADYLSRTRELAKACIATHILIDEANVEYSYSPVKNGQHLQFGDAELEVIHTPGHTMESTSFRLGDDAVFTGDTLFVDGVGRPDLKADQHEAKRRSRLLYGSLEKLLKLNSKTLVLPAHVATAVPFNGKLIAEKIGSLKDKLEVLQLSEDEFVKYTASRIPPTPPNYLTIANLNKKGSYDGYLPADLEAGANRCAIA